MKYLVLLLLSCFFYSACVKIKPKSSDPEPSAPVVSATNHLAPKVEIEDYQSFNAYGIRFQFAEGWPRTVIVESATEGSVTASSFQELSSERTLSLPLSHPGKRTEFRFYAIGGLEKQELARVQIDEPKDLFFEGLHTSQGGELVLRARKIYFQNAVFRNFAEGQKAARGLRGRDAGSITIVADRIEGDLQIVPQGEDGGDGLDGADPGLELKGRSGAPGRHGVIGEIRIVTPKDFGPSEIVFLKSQPTAGENGEVGRNGNSGRPGEDGGASAKIKVVVKNKENFRLDVKRTVSRGGQGGRGGLGGEGGEPGPAGWCHEAYNPKYDDIVRKFENCQVPAAAKKGLRGPDGPIGSAGREGAPAVVCMESSLEKCN